MDLAKFESDLTDSLHLSDTLSFGENVTLYNETLSIVLNERTHTQSRLKLLKPYRMHPGLTT